MVRLGIDAGEYSLDIALEHGIKGVPISAEKLASDGVEASLAPLRERGLEVCQIGAFGFNPLSIDKQGQEKQQEILEKVIPLANETGCPYIVINGGNYHPSGFGAGDARNFTDNALDEVADTLKPLLELAEKHNAKLSIEAYLKTAIKSPETFLRLKEKVADSDALRINIDPTSLYNYEDMWNPADKVEHVCTALIGHYGLGHLKGVKLVDGFHIHIELAPITEDPTDWSQVLKLMSPHIPDDSWIILEHISSPEEARASLALLQQVANDADVTLA